MTPLEELTRYLSIQIAGDRTITLTAEEGDAVRLLLAQVACELAAVRAAGAQ